MLQYLIVCPLVFLAGLVDSIAGGGGLIALPAYLIAGVPAHVALGTNKLSSAMGTTVSTACPESRQIPGRGRTVPEQRVPIRGRRREAP